MRKGIYSKLSDLIGEVGLHVSPQIEQFIESIFPSQDPKIVERLQAGLGADPGQKKSETAKELTYVFGAVMMVLFAGLFVLVRAPLAFIRGPPS